MDKFLLKIVGFGAMVLISICGIFLMADGTTDALYYKFTTPKQKSLVLGTSRAAQGIQPRLVDSILHQKGLFNYAFTIPSSPYGEIYLSSIIKKLDTINNGDGIFILEVNPWIFVQNLHPVSGKELVSEKNNFLDKTTNVTQSPNFEYLIRSYKEKYINILKNKNRKGAYQTFFVEEDGWLKVTIESDMISTEARTKNKLETYRNRLEKYKKISDYRLQYLHKTVKFLKKFGNVYLVRLPVIEGMLTIENELYPNFNEEMTSVSMQLAVPYLDYTSNTNDYSYTDGNHLDIQSATKFSLHLAEEIKTFE